MKKLLRQIKRSMNGILGTKADEIFWGFRHLFDRSWAEKYISEESIYHPHRKILIEKVSSYLPFESVLEVGCSSGPNLYLLAKRFPEVQLYGLDINKKAIKTGQKFFQKERISNVFLRWGKVDNLQNFQAKSIDIIISDATLIYAGPDRINQVIKEMLRTARKALILCEQHSELSPSLYKDRWIHNYKFLFQKFVPSERIKITKFLPGLWVGDWEKFGHIIEVVLN